MFALGAMALLIIMFFGMAHYMLEAVGKMHGMAQSTTKEMTAQRAAGYDKGYRMGMRQVNSEWWAALSAPEYTALREKFFAGKEFFDGKEVVAGTALKDSTAEHG